MICCEGSICEKKKPCTTTTRCRGRPQTYSSLEQHNKFYKGQPQLLKPPYVAIKMLIQGACLPVIAEVENSISGLERWFAPGRR
jgi:hypothetical protein